MISDSIIILRPLWKRKFNTYELQQFEVLMATACQSAGCLDRICILLLLVGLCERRPLPVQD